MEEEKIKLGVVFDQLLSVGGGFQQALNISKSLVNSSEVSFKVVFFTIYKENIEALKEIGINCIYIKNNKITRAILKIRSRFNDELLLKIINKLFGQNLFEKILTKENINLVYFISPSSWSNYLEKTNYIITVWDLCHRDFPEFPEVYESRIFERRESFFNNALRRAVAIIVDSNFGKENLIRRYGVDDDRVYVQPFSPADFVNHETLSINNKCIKNYELKPGYIFYPAQFWPHKNHIYILDAAEILREKYKTLINIVFVGSNKGNQGYIKDMINEKKLGKQVKILGFVKNSEMNCLYKNSLALVMPTYFGPTNIPPLEAFHHEIPIFYSNLPGIRDQLPGAAVLINLDDPESLAVKLMEIINNPKLRMSLINNAKLVFRESHDENHSLMISSICKSYLRKLKCSREIF